MAARTNPRGRPTRVPGEPADCRIELRLTLSELRAVRELADRSGRPLADVIRLALVGAAEDAGEAAPVLLGRRLALFLSGNKSGDTGL